MLSTSIRQTDFTPSKGNALQACIATILEIELSEVPNFILEPDLYASLRGFLSQYGLGFLKVTLNESGELNFFPGEGLCLLAGNSPRGPHRHVVIAKISSSSPLRPIPIFDPHPSDAFLSGIPLWAGFFIALDPHQTMQRRIVE